MRSTDHERWKRSLPVVLCSLIVVLASCGSASEPPLEQRSDGTAVTCSEWPGLVATSYDITRNVSDQALTIDSAEVVGAQGVTLLGIKLVALSEDEGARVIPVGLVRSWPPAPDSASEAMVRAYAETPEAEGMTIPADPDTKYAVTVGLEASDGGYIDHLRLEYSDEDGNEYVWEGTTSLGAGPPHC